MAFAQGHLAVHWWGWVVPASQVICAVARITIFPKFLINLITNNGIRGGVGR
jgi:hypothetical protein